MSDRPFMQLYVSDFVGDTLLLSTECIGAYLLLLIALWNAGGNLPDDEVKLARVARLDLENWRLAWSELQPFFIVGDGRVEHGRLTKELRKSASKSQARSAAGSKGGKAKALKDNEARMANAMPEPQHLPDTREKEKPSVSPKKSMDENWSLPGDWLNRSRSAYPSVSLASIISEASRFRDHYLASGAEFADWEPKWRNWLRNAFPSQEITPAQAKAAREVASTKVRLHQDDPIFRAIGRVRNRMPPTDRDGYWSFDPEEVERAKRELGRAA